MMQRFGQCRVAVVGDVMLDCYIDGTVTWISPEAPVPVLKFGSERAVAGGAANVAANIASLGGSVRLFGAVGEDQEARRLHQLLSGSRVDSDGLVALADRCTITKTRLTSARQQIARIDREVAAPLSESESARLLDRVSEALAWAQVLVLSDYGKGLLVDSLLRPLIERACGAGLPVIVDPKRPDFVAYRGATLITPNRRELSEATGLPCDTDEEAQEAAAAAMKGTGAEIILTRSEKGMSYFAPGEPALHLPTSAREVFDVSGAGDTVMAALALGMAAALPVAEAMRIANEAAGIVVGKLGTAVVTADELASVLAAHAHPRTRRKGALVSLEDAVAMRESWRRQGQSVGFTNGCFDLLHPGHVSLIEQAAAACDRLIVALNTDASVQRLKGPERPVQNEAARARVMGAMGAVDLVILFDDDTPLAAIRALKPDVLVKGADYALKDVVGAEDVIAAGGRVVLADLVAAQSTTRLVDRMRTNGG